MKIDPQTWNIALPERQVEGGTLFLPRSHLMDRFRAECFEVTLPPRMATGGSLTIRAGEVEAHPPPRHWLRGKPPREAVPGGRWVVDMRDHAPENFAHFLNDHLPLFFHLAETTGLDWDKALLLVRPDPPAHLLALAALFGLELWPTHAVVTGPGVEFYLPDWVALRSFRTGWTHGERPQAALLRAMAEDDRPLPKKPFLSRRGTRTLENAGEVEAFLTSRGYETVYAEDYPIPAQMRLFQEAEAMVAIHGAGIAPLMYCAHGRGPRHLVELLPVGLMSDVFREITHQSGARWIGVQGRFREDYVKHLYDLDTDFTQFAFDDFTIDPVSIEMALDRLDTSGDAT